MSILTVNLCIVLDNLPDGKFKLLTEW